MRGIVLMVLAAGLLLLNDAVAKILTERYPISEVLFLRQIAALVPVLLYVHYATGWQALVAKDRPGQLLRGVCFVGSVWLMVLSVALLPLPTVTAIAFASPLFIAAMSVPLLGESVGTRRWIATMVGLVGVVVIVRPGSAAFEWALLVPVVAAFVNGLRDTLTRRLSQRDNSVSILFWSSIIVLVVSLPTPLFIPWKVPAWPDVGLLVLGGLLNTGAHFVMIEALRVGRAAVIAPFRYSALIWSVMLGFLIWGDLPDVWTLAGAAILIATGIYMIRHRH